MEANAQRLLESVKIQILQFNVPDAERYEANVVAFLTQCPKDIFFADTIVKWDEKEEFDFLWDTARLDCRFSVGLEETSWHLWAGVNTHSKDDECFQHGIGGMGIEGNEDYFAQSFFEYLGWEFED